MYTISPLSGSSSGLEYPEVNTVVLLFARVTVSEPLIVTGKPIQRASDQTEDIKLIIEF